MVVQNKINNYGQTSFGMVNMHGAVWKNGFVANAGSGDIDCYTCPTGKRAMCSLGYIYNTAGTTTTYYAEIKSSAVYYKISASTSSFASTGGQTSTLPQIILEAGESYSVNTSQAGLNIWINVLEYDASVPMYSPRVLSLSNGDNTLYTVPANKTACIVPFNIYGAANNTSAGCYFNNSGTTRTLNMYIVPNGGSAGSTNKIFNNSSVNNGTANNQMGIQSTLSEGDFIVVNTNSGTTTQTAWTNVIEI